MDIMGELHKWECKHDQLVAAGDDDGAHVVREHLVRLRAMNGEHRPDTRRDWRKDLAAWQAALEQRRQKLAGMTVRDAGFVQLRNDVAEIEDHLRRLRILGGR
jgi:hypothetical protein